MEVTSKVITLSYNTYFSTPECGKKRAHSKWLRALIAVISSKQLYKAPVVDVFRHRLAGMAQRNIALLPPDLTQPTGR